MNGTKRKLIPKFNGFPFPKKSLMSLQVSTKTFFLLTKAKFIKVKRIVLSN